MRLLDVNCKRLIQGEFTSFLACAKVNLFLDITGKREDGYHLIKSLFVPVSLFDVLRFKWGKREGIKVICKESWFDPVNNSLKKAYNIFAEKTGFSPGLSISLLKNIPTGSGLGGASSNAAVVLNVLNTLMGLRNKRKLEYKELLKIASEVGADVPFFIKAKPAFVEGIGNEVKPVKIKGDLYLIIVSPNIPFYTKDMYSEYDRLNRLTKRGKGDKHLPPFWGSEDIIDYKDIIESVFNVFELVVRGSKHKMIEKIKKALTDCGANATALSGSGSAVFGIYKNELSGSLALDRLSSSLPNYRLFLVKVLKRGV